ncbi:MAG: glutathione S-transferase [Hyphomicrobiales bacterium]|nr:glutathione S-transferase [Hyphomicrobiales bacterium]MDE2016620.1 glutathione S-transferase [Hyphomicrobiales bacterium]
MELYDVKVAPNPRRVRIFLAEKGISVPLAPLDLLQGDQKTPDYARINPFLKAPALVLDDGRVITESIAICRHFEEAAPEPPLFGRTAAGRVEVEMWQRRVEFELFYQVAQAYRHTHPAAACLEGRQIADWADVCRARATEAMARFDAALDGREFIAGDSFSVADITGLVALDFCRPARIAIPPELTRLAGWRERLAARPSAKA